MSISGDRPPISTYEQALFWLIGEWVHRPAVLQDDCELPPEGRLVCDIFWVTHIQLRNDVRKRWRELYYERPGVSVLPLRRKGRGQ